jgi:hypothetical protein
VRDRLYTRLSRLTVVSERKVEFLPYRNQGVCQPSDQTSVVCGGRGNPQLLGAPRNGVLRLVTSDVIAPFFLSIAEVDLR